MHPSRVNRVAETAVVPVRRLPIWWIVAAVVLVLGYVDLARGGVTIGPILLVLGYCVCIPVAILR